jgi:MSHA pilin protein MshC
VELVTCIVIIGVLAAVAGPRFLDNRPYQERGYVDEVESALRYAQRVAAASGCQVLFTEGASGYRALQQPRSASGTCSGSWSIPVTHTDGTQLAGTPPAGVTLSPAAQIVFTAAGSLAGGAPAALSVGPFVLNIDGGSGLVSCDACK